MDRRQALALFAFTGVGALLKPIEAVAAFVPYSWYGSSLRLASGKVATPYKYYDGANIGIEMTCTASQQGSFKVQCCNDSGICLGSKQFAYKGFTKRTWRLPKQGRYRFIFEKATADGVLVTSSDVKMYSW